jgi:hypothetical protein
MWVQGREEVQLWFGLKVLRIANNIRDRAEFHKADDGGHVMFVNSSYP